MTAFFACCNNANFGMNCSFLCIFRESAGDTSAWFSKYRSCSDLQNKIWYSGRTRRE